MARSFNSYIVSSLDGSPGSTQGMKKSRRSQQILCLGKHSEIHSFYQILNVYCKSIREIARVWCREDLSPQKIRRGLLQLSPDYEWIDGKKDLSKIDALSLLLERMSRDLTAQNFPLHKSLDQERDRRHDYDGNYINREPRVTWPWRVSSNFWEFGTIWYGVFPQSYLHRALSKL